MYLIPSSVKLFHHTFSFFSKTRDRVEVYFIVVENLKVIPKSYGVSFVGVLKQSF